MTVERSGLFIDIFALVNSPYRAGSLLGGAFRPFVDIYPHLEAANPLLPDEGECLPDGGFFDRQISI